MNENADNDIVGTHRIYSKFSDKKDYLFLSLIADITNS